MNRIFLITILGLAIYANTLNGAFLWDDNYFVVENDFIKDIKLAPLYFTSKDALAEGSLSHENYRPLLVLSFAIDYFFWKLNPTGYHLTNLSLHILNAILVFYLITMLAENKFLGFCTALLFLTHPIQTEAVAWISGRSNVLFSFFYLLSLILYIAYIRKRKIIFYLSSILLFTCSLLSKEMAASLPFILVLYDLLFNREEALAARIKRYSHYLAILVFYVAIRFNVLAKLAQSGYWTGDAYTTILTMARGIVYYIRLLIYPVNLCADYSTFQISRSVEDPMVIFSLLGILSLFFIAVAFKNKNKYITFSILWFFITLLPVSNIIPVKILIAERFLYLPSMGFFLLVAIFLYTLYRSQKFKILPILLVSILIGAYSFLTVRQNAFWKDPVTFFKRIIKQCPGNARMHNNLGSEYYKMGKTQEAIELFKKAIDITPDYAMGYNNLGLAYYETKDIKEALFSFKKAIEIDPAYAEAYNNLGSVYYKMGDMKNAIYSYMKSISITPDYAPAYRNLALAYYRNNEFAKALEYCEKAKKFGPVNPRLLKALKERIR